MFYKNGQQLNAVDYICKKLHLRCLTEFWISLRLSREGGFSVINWGCHFETSKNISNLRSILFKHLELSFSLSLCLKLVRTWPWGTRTVFIKLLWNMLIGTWNMFIIVIYIYFFIYYNHIYIYIYIWNRICIHIQ